jgi:hypothetical protein
MAKVRIILLGLLSALVLSAVATATASAHEFFVEGTAITSNVAGRITSGTSVLAAEIIKTKVELVSSSDTGTFTLEKEGKSKYSISFTGNQLYEVNAEGHLTLLSSCGVSSLGSGKSVLLGTESPAGEDLDTFEPPEGKETALLEFEVTKCALKGKYKVEGTANGFLPDGKTGKALQDIVFNGEDQSLKVGGQPASIVSTESAVLNSGKKWGTSQAQSKFELASGESAEFKEETAVKSPLVLEAEKEPTIECSKMQIKKGVVTNGSPEATIQSIHFDGCEDKSEPACEVPTIETVEMTDTLLEDGTTGNTDERFAPKNDEGAEPEIASFKLKGKEGKTCTETSELKLAGDFISKKEDNEASEGEHKLGIAVTPELKELKYGDQLRFAFFSINFGWGMSITVAWFLFG